MIGQKLRKMTKGHWTQALLDLGACPDAVVWARRYPNLSSAWKACENGDWMLWLIDELRCSLDLYENVTDDHEAMLFVEDDPEILNKRRIAFGCSWKAPLSDLARAAFECPLLSDIQRAVKVNS